MANKNKIVADPKHPGVNRWQVDGKIGPKTRAALRAFQGSVGLPPDGYADAALLDRVRAAP